MDTSISGDAGVDETSTGTAAGSAASGTADGTAACAAAADRDTATEDTCADREPDVKGLRSSALRLWTNLDLRRIDLISDFGSGLNDPFLFEFDSLFLLACADLAADWGHGCQTLHLIWLAESIVRRLRERDAHVRIVLFDAHAALWSCTAGPVRLARAAVLRHLLWLAGEGRLELLRFAGWASGDWAAFLATEQPSLLLVSSGHVPRPLARAMSSTESLAELTAVFRALSVSCVLQRLPVALSTGLEFRGTQAVAHACSSLRRFGLSSREIILTRLSALCPAAVDHATADIDVDGASRSRSTRLQLIAAAVRRALGPDDETAGRILLLHGAMLDCLSLQQRSLGRVPICRPAAAFFDRACAALADMPCIADPLSSADLVDGRLFHALLARLAGPTGEGALWAPAALGLDEAASEELSRLWRWVAAGHGDFWAPLGLRLAISPKALEPDVDDHEDSSGEGSDGGGGKGVLPVLGSRKACNPEKRRQRLARKAMAGVAGPPELLPISCPVLDEYFELTPFGRPPDHKPPAELEADRGGVCVERYHWHSGRNILGDDGELADSSDEDDAKYRRKAGSRGVIPRHWRMLLKIRIKTRAYLELPPEYKERPTPMETRLVDEWRAQEKRTLDQKYMRWLQRYANSLGSVQPVSFATAAAGRGQQLQADPEPPEPGTSTKAAQRGKQKPAKSVSSKAKEIIARNMQRLGEKRADADEEKVDTYYCDFCEPELKHNPERAVALLSKFIAEKLAGGSRAGRLKARIRLLVLCKAAWEARPSEKPVMERAARLFHLIVSTPEEFNLTEDDREELKALCYALRHLGYPTVADQLRPGKEHQCSKKGRPAGISPARLQMLYGGRYMTRDVDPSPDPRVLFVPDRWQRDLLDVVDRGESALVVAPTSAGKTFAAYYAMEKVLRADDEGICVFIAPTKALVNQVSAEVYARFGSKQYRDGTCVVGIKTRDYDHCSRDCQILVTVPAMLEILLLSPLEAVQVWCRRIRFVIFDEVHCLGLDSNINRESGAGESGAVWEHLLLLIRCPFLALSATISNPEDLRSWMAQKQGRRAHLVQFDVRYSDLRKHVYAPSGAINTIHPFSALTAAKMRRGGIPRDMALAPDEILQLYDEMRAGADRCGLLDQEEEAEAMRALDPDVFFSADLCITKARARDFEAAVKATFVRWSASAPSSPPAAAAEATLCSLSAAADVAFEDESISEKGDEHYNHKQLLCRFVPLLRSLQEEDKLPAIGFCFDRLFCEKLALDAAKQLAVEERQWRTSPEGRRRVAEREAKAQERREQREALRRALEQARGQLERDAIESTGARDEAAEEFDEGGEACEDEFTFVRRAEGLTPKEYADLVAGVREELARKQQLPRYEPLLAVLRRGIGVHHAGLQKKFRETVEILFRRRHIKVVLATGTLALGINMPCRTVVMVGDSVYLTPLQYRQMSGRAGRRGFDDLGHVIFFGLPRARVDRLLTADIPRIRGHFPLTVTLMLRAMCLYTQAGLLLPGASAAAGPRAAERKLCVERAADLVLGLFRQPLVAVGRPAIADQVYHHVRYSLDLLRRERLLAANAEVLGLAGMCMHLHYTEPANLALAHLISTGLLHKMLAAATSRAEGERQLVLVLAHLFCTLPQPLPYLRRRMVEGRVTPSLVLLPPLPPAIAMALKRQTCWALQLCCNYVRCFVTEKVASGDLRLESALPISGLTHPAWTTSASSPGTNSVPLFPDESTLEREPCVRPYLVSSPFAALAGRGDHFKSGEEMAAAVREGIALELTALPTIPSEAQRAARGNGLNAYLLDFYVYTHGQWQELETSNWIRHGDVWFVLQDFGLILLAVLHSVERLAPGSIDAESDEGSVDRDPLVRAFRSISARWHELTHDGGGVRY